MVKTVIKRDGSECNFDKSKIKIAVLKAFIEVDKEETDYAKEKARDIANYVESLDIEKMQEAVKYFIGEHDFKAFKASGTSSKSSVREIYLAEIKKEEFVWILDVTMMVGLK